MNSLIDDFIDKCKQNDDLIVTNYEISNSNLSNIIIVYMIDMVDIKKFNFEIKPYLNEDTINNIDKKFLGIGKNISDISFNNLDLLLYSGNILLFYNEKILCFDFANKVKRTPTKSAIDPEDPLSSQDALIEDLNTNITLIKKRIKSSDLKIDKYELGIISKTTCAILYNTNFYDQLSLNKIIKKLKDTTPEIVSSINDINILLQDDSLLPKIFNTSSPEIITSALNKGRIVLILDNSPVAAIIPATLSTFTTSKSYINTPKYYSIFNHIFIMIFLFISLFLMGLFIAIINFHPGILSLSFLANVIITERGTNWPMFYEVLIVYFLFEFYRFATSRSTYNYIQNIIIILGGLFVGQNAIESGTIGATILFLTSISYLAVFAVTNNIYLITSINIFRFFILIMSYAMGILGFLIASTITIFYLYKQNNSSEYYLYPFIPFNLKDFKKYFIPNNYQEKVTK